MRVLLLAIALLLSGCGSKPTTPTGPEAPLACDPDPMTGPAISAHPFVVGSPEDVANRTAQALGLTLGASRGASHSSISWDTSNGILGYDPKQNGSIVWAFFREPWLPADAGGAHDSLSSLMARLGLEADLQVDEAATVVSFRLSQATPAGRIEAGNGWSGSPDPPVNGGWKGVLWLQPLFDPDQFDAPVIGEEPAEAKAVAFERCQVAKESGNQTVPYTVLSAEATHASLPFARLAYAVDLRLVPTPGSMPSVDCLSRVIHVDAVTGSILARDEVTGC